MEVGVVPAVALDAFVVPVHAPEVCRGHVQDAVQVHLLRARRGVPVPGEEGAGG